MCCHPLCVDVWIRLTASACAGPLATVLHRLSPGVAFERSLHVHHVHETEPLAAVAMIFVKPGRFNSVLLRTGRNSIDILEIRRMKLENHPASRIYPT
jgi:hypothetical protein